MLRGRLPDKVAAYADPVLGVNLRDSLEDLKPGEAERMENCFYDGGLRKRFGSITLAEVSQGAFRGRGARRIYPKTASKYRVVAFAEKLMTVSDAGAYGTVTFTLTSDQDTFITPWSITDRTYICNKSNELTQITNSTQAFLTVTGTNIPASPTMVEPYLDRLFAIQGDAVYSSNPRVHTTWSPNTSTWATYRPSGGTGDPTCIHLHSLTGNLNNPLAQLLIFQENALTGLAATNLGSDVTAASPPSGWDATMTLLAPNIGTKSPHSVVTVPGVGTFWFTQDANVAWLDFASSVPKLIGDKLYSNRGDISGLNDVNFSNLGDVWMVYHDRKLKLFLPVASNNYSTIQYWLDLRSLQSVPLFSDTAKVSWSGPHTEQNLSAVWVESAGGDADVLYGCEGRAGGGSNGFFIYTLNVANTYTDDDGAVRYSMDYRTFYHDFGVPSYEKYMPTVRFDASGELSLAEVTIRDLHGNAVSGLTIVRQDGSAFTVNRYGTGLTYGNGYLYGASFGQSVGQTMVDSQGTTAVLGDAIQVQITHQSAKTVSSLGSGLTINRILPQVQVRRSVPVP